MKTLFEDKPKPAHENISSALKQKHTSMVPFAAFAFHPKNIHFETQESSEVIILFLRQHLILLIPWLIFGVLLFLVPPVVVPILGTYLQLPVVLPLGYVIVGIIFWYVAAFGFILTKLIRWYFNIFIVTDDRIVDIDFINLLYKEFSEAKISRVQDITYQTRGILATIFDFGDVIIQTAGELPNFVFESVPHPADVVHVISDLVKTQKGENL